MTKRAKSTTAAELMAKLQAKPQWLAKQRAVENERRRVELELQEAEKPLLAELATVGSELKSLWTQDRPKSYPEAIQILLAHLQKPYPSRTRKGIALALAIPDAAARWEQLVALFRAESDSAVKWGLALALQAAATDAHLDEIAKIVSNHTLGENRLPLVEFLGRSRHPAAREPLVGLTNSGDLREAAEKALRQGGRTSPKVPQAPVGMAETSLNIDVPDASTLLTSLARRLSFTQDVVLDLEAALAAMTPDEERHFEYEAMVQGQRIPLGITFFMSDIDAVDVYFQVLPSLVSEVEKEVAAFQLGQE